MSAFSPEVHFITQTFVWCDAVMSSWGFIGFCKLNRNSTEENITKSRNVSLNVCVNKLNGCKTCSQTPETFNLDYLTVE